MTTSHRIYFQVHVMHMSLARGQRKNRKRKCQHNVCLQELLHPVHIFVITVHMLARPQYYINAFNEEWNLVKRNMPRNMTVRTGISTRLKRSFLEQDVSLSKRIRMSPSLFCSLDVCSPSEKDNLSIGSRYRQYHAIRSERSESCATPFFRIFLQFPSSR